MFQFVQNKSLLGKEKNRRDLLFIIPPFPISLFPHLFLLPLLFSPPALPPFTSLWFFFRYFNLSLSLFLPPPFFFHFEVERNSAVGFWKTFLFFFLLSSPLAVSLFCHFSNDIILQNGVFFFTFFFSPSCFISPLIRRLGGRGRVKKKFLHINLLYL